MAPGITQKFSLSEFRVNRGQSVEALANEIGIDWRTLRRLERGQAVLVSKAKLVADFAGVQVTDLMPLEREAA